MKKSISVLALLFCIFYCTAQTGADVKQAEPSVKSDTVKRNKYYDVTFTKAEIESHFPGGEKGWIAFLQQNLTYPKKAVRKKIEGTVLLQFIVGTDGTVSDIQAISGPEELRQSAIETMKKSPNWIPATQGGKKVKSYKKQPIVYRIER